MSARLIFWIVFLPLSVILGYLFWSVPQLRAPKISIGESLEVSITIPEGKNFKEIARILVKNHLASTMEEAEEAQREVSKENKFTWLEGAQGLEGYLFPDTYRFYRVSGPKRVFEAMLANFERRAGPVFKDAAIPQGLDFRGAIILASIIERESTAQDREMIADIFLRRLRRGMPLQADSTVNYVTGRNKAALSYTETKIDSPYNTYMHRGLPPGPISNPGIASIMAVFYPKANDYWYFLSTKQGKIIYSRTIEEHLRQKSLHLR